MADDEGAVLPTAVDTASASFRANRAHWEAQLATLAERLAWARAGGGPEAVRRHHGRGKLLARERIDALVDPGTAFLEFSPLAAWELYDGEAPAAGIVTGIGVIHGQEC